MFGLENISFLYPWVLVGLISLPVLWWLMRFLPPRPRYLRFPALIFLLGLDKQEKTSAQTPWWLLLLRLLIAGFFIIGLSQPIWKNRQLFKQTGPVIVIVDNDWSIAPSWNDYRQKISDLLVKAEQEQKEVLLIPTASIDQGFSPSFFSAVQAKTFLNTLQPQSWFIERQKVKTTLEQIAYEGTPNIFWYSNGLLNVHQEDSVDQAFADYLIKLGEVHFFIPNEENLPLLIQKAEFSADSMNVVVIRPSVEANANVKIVGYDNQASVLFSETGQFADNNQALIKVGLPSELRNRLQRIVVVGQSQAGATLLIDDQSKIKPVGILSTGALSASQPLLSDTYYVQKALSPYSEVRVAEEISKLLERPLSLLILVDVGKLNPSDEQNMSEWIKNGGTLLRFAGPRLAQNADSLLPVRLRVRDRSLGGALSWSSPARLSPFPNNSPFQGLVVPQDIVVLRQILAEPDTQLTSKTWARLEDGTPLVTQEIMGKGRIILVHTTANPDWSNFALSGLFVQMLQKILDISTGTGGVVITMETLPPRQVLDGWGNLTIPSAQVLSASPEVFNEAKIDWQHPPGFYGRQNVQRALNLGSAVHQYKILPTIEGMSAGEISAPQESIDFKPYLLTLVCLLFLLDLLVSLAVLRPGINRRMPAQLALFALIMVGFALISTPGYTQTVPRMPGLNDKTIIDLTKITRLAYIKSGITEIDRTSQRGLATLSAIVNSRTSVVLGEPVALDPEKDELSFYPFIYWPVVAEHAIPSENARRRLNQYLRTGGMIVFDTRDQGVASIGETPAQQRLQQIATGLDIPPLKIIPKDHVLGKTFYLLSEFPGRWRSQSMWVERDENIANDGVSSVIIGGADWAAAWAYDENGRPMFRVVPGGDKQREMSFRFGVNLILYTLTGQYKSDQIHVPAILERLGEK